MDDIQMDTVRRIYKAFGKHYKRSDVSASYTFSGRYSDSTTMHMHLHVSGWPGENIPLCHVWDDGRIMWCNDLEGYRIALTYAGSNPTRERWNEEQWLAFCKEAKGEQK